MYYEPPLYDITPYDYLEHHGVKGMKWGVRRYRDENGNWTNKAKIGTSKRVRQKQKVLQSKVDKSDRNFLARNTINDYRRGQIAALEAKARHREAKESGDRNIALARGAKRYIPNALLSTTAGTIARGRWHRRGGPRNAIARLDKRNEKLRNKIAKSDKNIIARNTINDYRRGQIAYNEHAREYHQARLNRDRHGQNIAVGKMAGTAVALAQSPVGVGRYKRSRAAGQSVAKSLLGVAGATAVTNLVLNETARLGTMYVDRMMRRL